MPAALTTAERFERAEAALAEARRLAHLITEQTPGKERGPLIIRTRSQCLRAHSYIGRMIRRNTTASPAEQARAAQILADVEKQLHYARRFSQ